MDPEPRLPASSSLALATRRGKPCSPGTAPVVARTPGVRRSGLARFPDPYTVLVSEIMLQQTQAASGRAGVRRVRAAIPGRALTGGRVEGRRVARLGSPGVSAASRRSTAPPPRSSASTGARCRATRRCCARCRGSASTRRQPSRAWVSARRCPRSTRTSGARARVDHGSEADEVSARARDAASAWLDRRRPRPSTRRSWISAARSAGRLRDATSALCAPGARSLSGTRRPAVDPSAAEVRGLAPAGPRAVLAALRPVAPHVRRPLARDRRAGAAPGCRRARPASRRGGRRLGRRARGRERGRVALPD